MRIALVHYTVFPTIGGVERVIEEHARQFGANGHEVTLVAANAKVHPRSGEPALKRAGVELMDNAHPDVVAARADAISGRTGPAFLQVQQALVEELRGLLHDQDIVIVHNVCTMPFHLALTAALAELPGQLPDVRFLAWTHDVAAVNPDYGIPETGPWRLLRNPLAGFQYVVVSELRRQQWESLTGQRIEAARVIPNGIDPARELRLTPLMEHVTLWQRSFDRELVLFHPTRLLRRKNVEASLRITAEIRALGVDAALMITAATDPHHAPSAIYAEELRALRTELGLEDDATFLSDLGPVSEDDVRSAYAVADALLFPSRQEGFGIPLLEAALHRIPAFCSDIEPLRSLPGAVPMPMDAPPRSIAEAIIRQMRELPANPPRRAVLRNYTWSAIYRKYLDPLLRETKNC